ncbi:ATP-binding cassette domain-containing protein [Acidiferrimicrobium sp. IK]|uniref:ATP-binding cassette domain-containing protein n=1 Tax=Acidiferrimicrobium sp. IK TaxID=2871700 RepID=UPI0021CB3B79|nr:ATP-binding cassette domain-containing protein [Acidiferrimicrobium sp. IK]MCU4185256.1 ATP-binding cassette domain-containing protein [Acidiferrimicrobium sp. IK]
MTWGVEGATVTFGRRVALDGVYLDVAPGSVTVVVGGDGAGKSTLLRAMVGLVRLSAGRASRPAKARIGYVPATAGLYVDLTVQENLAFAGRAYRVGAEEYRARSEELIERIGLADARGRLAGRLSGGMQRKLAVAMALLHRPALLVLDEPTTGVDPVSRSELWRLIAGAAAQGAGVVAATTYLDEVTRASRVLLMEDGRTIATGSPSEVLAAVPRSGHAPGRDRSADCPRGGGQVALVGARSATIRFGEVTAVDGVDLEVGASEVVGLLGANGAGKTTLIRMLLGLLPPSSGSVSLFGRPPSRAGRRRLGYVPQTLGLYADLTVDENWSFVASAFGIGGLALPDSLAGWRHEPVGRLSLGVQRRVAFAVAFSHDPELLVLDEPTSGVGPLSGSRLWEDIHSSAQRGTGVVITTHSMEEAEHCDRLVVMAAGRVVASGTVAEVIGQRTVAQVDCDDWRRAFAVLDGEGLTVQARDGRLRVPGTPEGIRHLLERHHIRGDAAVVAANLEEAFVDIVTNRPRR